MKNFKNLDGCVFGCAKCGRSVRIAEDAGLNADVLCDDCFGELDDDAGGISRFFDYAVEYAGDNLM